MTKHILKIYLFFIVCLIIAGLIFVVFIFNQGKSVRPQNHNHVFASSPEPSKVLPINFYDKKSFSQAVNNPQCPADSDLRQAQGGILPHHLAPIDLIAQYYCRFAKARQPRTIILLGPDHYDANLSGAITSSYSWQTEFGLLEPDTQIIEQLLETKLVTENNQVFENEHSIAAHVHFIKYYFPRAKIVPIIFRSDYSQDKAVKLAENIARLSNDNVFILASIDFSHYLKSAEAQNYDNITIETMKNFDYNTLYAYDSKYFDSKASIVTILKSMEILQTTAFNIMANTNSGIIANDPGLATTSYFFLYFTP